MIVKAPERDGPKRDVTLSTFTPEKALEIIELIAEGRTLSEICRTQPGMPHPNTFRRWMVQHPDYGKAYSVAVQVSAVSLEEEALDTARAIAKSPKDGTHVRAAEVRLGQLRWSMERRDPNKYGNKTQVSVKVPVQIITPMDLGGASNESIPDIYTLEAKQVTKLPNGDELTRTAKQISVGPVKKRRLVPPSGVKMTTPFSKMMRGITDERQSVRPEGSGSGDRGEQLGVGGQELPPEGGEEGATREERPGPDRQDAEREG